MAPTSRSEIMRAVKSRDTSPERLVASLLDELAIEYSRDDASLPGRPDFVVRRVKRGQRPIALFVHGCWWHAHSCKRGARVPKTNRKYWREKIDRNRRRDRRVARELRAMGYSVWTLWECRLMAKTLPTRFSRHLQRTARRKK